MTNRIVRINLVVALVWILAAPAWALELPAHAPGTICVSPDNYWCWISQVPRGAPCACPSPYGPVNGSAQ